MSLGDILGQLFYGATTGLDTYNQLHTAREEKKYRRTREALEDDLAKQANQRAYEAQQEQLRTGDETRTRQQQQDFVKELEDAGIKGGLTAYRSLRTNAANQTQAGAGVQAGMDLNNVAPQAMSHLQEAMQKPDYN